MRKVDTCMVHLYYKGHVIKHRLGCKGYSILTNHSSVFIKDYKTLRGAKLAASRRDREGD